MVRFLLLPDDERAFVEWLQHEHGLQLAAAVEAETGLTRLKPLSQLPSELPGPLGGEPSSVPREFVLRAPDWGTNDLDPWDTESAVARVMRSLNTEAAQKAGVSRDDLIDFERTRVIRFRRCGWTRTGELQVAALQGSARPARLQDPTVAATLKSAERWLARGAVRVELPQEVRYRPRILARPQAHDWVQSGGVVYPWDA
jgi:hypothetical protein